VRDRHLAFYVALAEAAAPHTYAADHAAWLERVRQEFANLRAALDWSVTTPGSAEAGLRIVSGLMRYWDLLDLPEEGARWLGRTLAAAGPLGAVPEAGTARLRAQTLARGAYAVIRAGDLQRALALVEEALGLCRQYGSQADLGFARLMQAWALADMGDLERAEPLFVESAALAHGAGELYFAAVAQFRLAHLALGRYDYNRAARLLDQILVTCRELGDAIGIADTLQAQSRVAAATGQFAEATVLCRDALSRFRHLALRGATAESLVHLGVLLRDQGEHQEAQTCLEEALDIYRNLGYQLSAAQTLIYLADVVRRSGNLARAATLLEEAWPQVRALGAAWLEVRTHRVSGGLARARAEADRAAEHLGAALRVSQPLPTERATFVASLRELALVNLGLGQPAQAIRLLAAAGEFQAAIRLVLAPSEQRELDEALAAARRMLGDAVFEQAWAEGLTMTEQQVTALACG
jgi:tetratricopeptide (TPR) repeat protein